MFAPRDYQLAAVSAVWQYLAANPSGGNPAIVLPTGAGKTIVISSIVAEAVRNWGGRVLVLAHVKELLEQSAEKIRAFAPDLDVGVYSAGLGRRQTENQVIVAGVQSVYNKAAKIHGFDLVLIDEAHMIPPDGEGMYQKLLGDLKKIRPHVRLIGLTATPYRLSSGEICGPDCLLNEIAFEVGVRELIAQGYLSKLVSKSVIDVDTSKLHVRAGEFVADEAAALMAEVVSPACQEIVERTRERRSVITFCQSVEHATQVRDELRALDPGQRAELITGETAAGDRSSVLAAFKAGEIKYLTNVNVLTTGFDAPGVDCVAMLRPTLSAGLYYQSVGRGFRLAPGKSDCLVLDFAGNIKRHGPVDLIKSKPNRGPKSDDKRAGGEAPTKTCDRCEAVIAAGFSACPHCGYEFPETGVKHSAQAEAAAILSGDIVDRICQVRDVRYLKHFKRSDPDAPLTMRVIYKISLFEEVSEWVCIEHPRSGFAHSKARSWWLKRSNDPIPPTVDRAIDVAAGGGLATPIEITVREVSGEKFPQILEVKLGEIPEGVPFDPTAVDDWDFPGKAEMIADVEANSIKYGEPGRELTEAEIDELGEIPF